jgi:rare lipoprotein A
LFLCLALSGCGRHEQARVNAPPPPAIKKPSTQNPQPAPPSTAPQYDKETGPESAQAREAPEVIPVPPNAKPLYVETGKASWYGAPYHNRRASNGEVYNMHAMTAAHRTLPLGSIVRVTNMNTGHSAIVRITDRGPFINGRILDLSLAAAKAVDVWLPGVAMVRMEVLQTPASMDSGGHWAVQIGGFDQQRDANDMVELLSRRYHTAKVQSFNSPAGNWWVRVRVLDDNRQRAEELARDTRTPEGGVFVVRLD